MSHSKPLSPFVFDSLYYLNRDQLDRFSMVCRSLKYFIVRYFHSKPYRIFDRLDIRGGSYALLHNDAQWHPNQEEYSVRQFLAAHKCNIAYKCYSFAEMRPYLGLTIRTKETYIFVAGDSTYNPEHIEEMESITYLWRDGDIDICKAYDDTDDNSIVGAEVFQPILNSPTILQCRHLDLAFADFSFNDYKVLYTVKVIETFYYGYDDIELNYWPEFLEKPGVKPIIALHNFDRENINILLDLLSKAFSSTVLPNSFKIVFLQYNEPLTEFRETNKTSGEVLELKKGLPTEYQKELWKEYDIYTLERSNA